jgi:hypothetical protein
MHTINKKFLNGKLDTIAELLDMPRSKQQAIEKNREHYLTLDYNEYYGYAILIHAVNNGGVGHFMNMQSMTNTECDRYMQAIFDILFIYPQMSYLKEPLKVV